MGLERSFIQCRRYAHLWKCSLIRSSRVLSGKFATQRCRVSRTILPQLIHGGGLCLAFGNFGSVSSIFSCFELFQREIFSFHLSNSQRVFSCTLGRVILDAEWTAHANRRSLLQKIRIFFIQLFIHFFPIAFEASITFLRFSYIHFAPPRLYGGLFCSLFFFILAHVKSNFPSCTC